MKFQPGQFLVGTISILVFIFIAEKVISKYYPQQTYSASYAHTVDCFKNSDYLIFEVKPNCNFKFRVFDKKEVIETQVNSEGLRDDEVELTKKSGEKRILLLGDSFILGWSVQDKDVSANILEKKLGKPWNVINAGYAGAMGPDGYFLYLKNKGIKLNPDLVIFSVYVYNDFTDINDNEWIGLGKYGEPEKLVSKKLYVDKNGVLLPRKMPLIYKLPGLKNSHLAVLVYKSLVRVNRRIIGIVKDKERGENLLSLCVFADNCGRETFGIYNDILAVIKASRDLVEGNFKDGKIHFLVMIIPADFQINSNLKEKYKEDSGIPDNAVEIGEPYPQKRLKEMLIAEKIAYFDLLPSFRNAKENLYYPTDGHWNSEGHKLAAEELYNWINKNYGNISPR